MGFEMVSCRLLSSPTTGRSGGCWNSGEEDEEDAILCSPMALSSRTVLLCAPSLAKAPDLVVAFGHGHALVALPPQGLARIDNVMLATRLQHAWRP